jgi:VanZ family protein
MSTVSGLPVHVLLVHFIVVLAPLTALLVIGCGVWPPARRRLVWLTLVLAAVITVLTPLTTDAGEWLVKHVAGSAAVHTHTELGDTMIYFSAALLVAALATAAVHLRERKTNPSRALTLVVAALALVVGTGTIVQVYRIGESGSRAAWSDVITTTDSAP